MPTSPAPLSRVAIYARISDDRADGAGVGRQLQDCRALVDTKGWGQALEFVDNDVSASSSRPRPRFRELLAAVRGGKVGRIVVWSTDRLYRRPRDLEDLIDLVEGGRVDVVSVTGGEMDLETTDGRLTARFLVSVSRSEVERLSTRVRRQQQERRSAGAAPGGRPSFGYRRAGQGRLEVEPTEAALISRAVDDILAGATISDVAKQWTSSGVVQPRGEGGWHPTVVRSTLTSPRIAGLLAHRGEVVGAGAWEPIVGRARWEQLRAELERRRMGYATLRRQRSALTGLLVCGRCGAGLMHGRTRGTKTYRCKKGPGSPGCGRVQIAAEPLERDLADVLFAYLDSTDLATLVGAGADTETAALSRELTALERQAAETAELAAAGELRPVDFARFSAGVEVRQTKLRRRLDQLSSSNVLGAYAGRPGALRRAWDDLSPSERRVLLVGAFGRLTVDPAQRMGYALARVRGDAGPLSPAQPRVAAAVAIAV